MPPAKLLAGAASRDITPPQGGLMDGYGARREPSMGVRDPLRARALVLESDDGGCAIVSCDLLGVHPQWVAKVRERVTTGTRIPGDRVLVAATHNHAGPYGLRGGLFSRYDAELANVVADRVSSAVAEAYSARRPATLALGSAVVDTVSQNRRHPDWPIDPVLRVLLVDPDEGGPPVAAVMNFACHGTVLDATNLLLSAEFPGVACRLIQQETGAVPIYLNGACGDVNPAWVRQDFESVERVGQIVGGEALRLIAELRAAGQGQRAHNIRWDEFTDKPVPGRLIEPRLRAANREIELPQRQFAADEEYAARIRELESRVGALAERSDERREVMAQLTRAQAERWTGVWARIQPEEATLRTEVQALLLGEGLALLALPGEFFAETAEAIRAECGFEDLLVACYANEYVGYAPPAHAYDEGGYEPGVTPFAPEAEALVRRAAIEMLRSLAG